MSHDTLQCAVSTCPMPRSSERLCSSHSDLLAASVISGQGEDFNQWVADVEFVDRLNAGIVEASK
jgi:hypothetical protein